MRVSSVWTWSSAAISDINAASGSSPTAGAAPARYGHCADRHRKDKPSATEVLVFARGTVNVEGTSEAQPSALSTKVTAKAARAAHVCIERR